MTTKNKNQVERVAEEVETYIDKMIKSAKDQPIKTFLIVIILLWVCKGILAWAKNEYFDFRDRLQD